MSQAMIEWTFFFCLGYQKTGTTILARMLDQHPEIACLWESYALRPTSKNSIFNPNSANVAKNGFDAEQVSRWARALAPYRPQTLKARAYSRLTGRQLVPVRRMRRILTEALTDFGRRCNSRVVGDKWPGYCTHVDTIQRIFPQARYIYNVRDPRGVWNSGQRFKGRARGEEVLDGMLEYDARVSEYLGRENFITVRYEDCICRVEETFRRLYEFLGCEFSPSYLGYDPSKDRYPDRWGWVPEAGEPLDAEHAVKWKRQLTAEEIAHVNAKAAGFMATYGYGDAEDETTA